jgi:hypothetical protein
MRIPTPLSDAAAKEASRRELWKPGLYDGCFSQAIDRLSQNHNEMIEAVVVVRDANGNTREFRDYLNAASPISSAKLRQAAEAVGALAKYEAGEIGAADFLNHQVKVRIGVEKHRGFQPRNTIEGYQSAASPVVKLRTAG